MSIERKPMVGKLVKLAVMMALVISMTGCSLLNIG